MNILYILMILLLVLVLAAVLEIYRELHHFCITRYDVTSEKFSRTAREVKLLFLSDLHNRTYGRENRKLLQSIKEEEPDIILIGGDMLVGKANVSCDTALDFMRQLPEICPVIYANGNHELRMKEDREVYGDTYTQYKNSLEKCGVLFLENESLRVELGEKNLHIFGLELPVSSCRKFKKASVTAKDIETYLGAQANERKDSYTILLAHNPAYMEAYLEWGADMVLSGHLHGGLVRVPGIGGIVTPQGFLFPKYSGEMTQAGEQTVIVSRGLGTHTMNIRLFNTPELVSICLGGKGAGRGGKVRQP